jgi:hypothetical protein
MSDVAEYNILKRVLLKDKAVFFTVSWRIILSEWQEFKGGRVYTLEEAEKIAETQSGVYVDSVVRVSVGSFVLSLWFDGKCEYVDKELHELFEGKDFEKAWR